METNIHVLTNIDAYGRRLLNAPRYDAFNVFEDCITKVVLMVNGTTETSPTNAELKTCNKQLHLLVQSNCLYYYP